MQTIWRVHRASAQYTSVALEIHCFGVNIPSHAHASGVGEKRLILGMTLCVQNI